MMDHQSFIAAEEVLQIDLGEVTGYQILVLQINWYM